MLADRKRSSPTLPSSRRHSLRRLRLRQQQSDISGSKKLRLSSPQADPNEAEDVQSAEFDVEQTASDETYAEETEAVDSEEESDEDLVAHQAGTGAVEDTPNGNIRENEEAHITIIPHRPLRPLGRTEYASHTVHENTLLFLEDLRANNTRPWFKSSEMEYRRAADDWKSFIESLNPKVIYFDNTIPELPPNDMIFRIYRDVRFSKDQRPYKSHFSAAFSRTGRKRPYACYYLHLDPGASFVGGGLWAPEAQTIQLLRQSIDEDPRQWHQILNAEPFRATFLPNAGKGLKGALQEFAKVNSEGALKTRPKGYGANHPSIQLLKLRNYHVIKPVDDHVFTSANSQEQIVGIISKLLPFVTFLNSAIMPDVDDG